MGAEPMRERFVETASSLLDRDERLVVVLAEISAKLFAPAAARHPARVVNVGIREQLMVSVASGFALTGFRPIVHTIASFAVERPYEQLKIDLGHQDAGAVLVTHGASYDYAESGRTHQAPEDVAVIDALPGWDIHVPGHPDEAERLITLAAAGRDRAYVRLAISQNSEPHRDGVVRRGNAGTVVAVGPMLDRVLVATAGLDLTVLYFATVRPFDGALLRATLSRPDVVIVEPYLEGTSCAEVASALVDVPHRLLAIGVPKLEHRRYGTIADHDAAHGLDAASLRLRIVSFLLRAP